MSTGHREGCICMECSEQRGLREIDKATSTATEMSWSDVRAFVKRITTEPRGKRRAANLIREIASELAEADACEDLANASMELQRMLVLSWEHRLEREKSKTL